jgi:DNA-binding CsgD family transcriptional regulator
VLLDEAKAGEGRIAVIHGEAGIGKTSVVKAFTTAHQDTSHVLWAGCDDLLATRPLGPIWDIAAFEMRLVEPLRGDDRLGVFRAVLDLLARSVRPTILVIEDVHWADEATLDLVTYVGRRIEHTSGLLILTYRGSDLVNDHPVRRVLAALPHHPVEGIALAPLSRDAVTQLAGDPFEGDNLWRTTGGNPFFVTELLGSGDTMPDSIKDSIRGTLSRLSPGARNLVELVSVTPTRVRMQVVRRILGDVVDLVEECERRRILEVRGEALRFRHELARRAVEGDLEEIRRRDLNLAVLEACEAVGEPLSRCAHHARQAHDPEAMLRLLPEAAREAAILESHREALSHLEALEPYLDRMTPLQLARHYQLWAEEQYVQDFGLASELSDKAVAQWRLIGDPALLGRALLMACRIKYLNTERAKALALAEEAVALLKHVGGEDLALAYAALSRLAMNASSHDESLRWADLALAHADDSSSEARVEALISRGTIKGMIGNTDGFNDLEEAYRLSTEHHFLECQFRSIDNLAAGYLDWSRPELAERWIRLGVDLCEEIQWEAFGDFLQAESATLDEMRGHWAEAESAAQSVRESSNEKTRQQLIAALVLARIKTRQGSPEAADVAMETWERAQGTDEIQWLAPAGAVLAEELWLGAEIDDELIDELRSVVAESVDRDVGVLAGELAQFLSLAGALGEMPEEIPEPYSLLDRGEWAAAAAFWHDRGIPYQLAVALSQGDTSAKLRALEILNDLRAVPLAERIRSQLREVGVRAPRGPHTATRKSSLGLTRRQAQVLDLLIERLSNEQIANRLYISARTVENHVSAILHKLGAKDRNEAVRLAQKPTHDSSTGHLLTPTPPNAV